MLQNSLRPWRIIKCVDLRVICIGAKPFTRHAVIPGRRDARLLIGRSYHLTSTITDLGIRVPRCPPVSVSPSHLLFASPRRFSPMCSHTPVAVKEVGVKIPLDIHLQSGGFFRPVAHVRVHPRLPPITLYLLPCYHTSIFSSSIGCYLEAAFRQVGHIASTLPLVSSAIASSIHPHIFELHPSHTCL